MKTQRPSTPENWLYRDIDEENRYFTKLVFMPDDAPDYPECTNEEKEQWEEEHHPQPEPEEPVNEERNE